jgi:hypothetical protein
MVPDRPIDRSIGSLDYGPESLSSQCASTRLLSID